MEKISLQDGFTLKVLGENVYHIPEEEIEAKVPGTVYGTLLDKGLMPDPYFGENELTATKLMENDFEYRKEFFVTEEMTSADGLYLVFEGIDTLSDIYLNEEKIGSTDNMHRTYSFDVLERLKIGKMCCRWYCIPLPAILRKKMKKSIPGAAWNVWRDFLIFEKPTVCLDGTGVPDCRMPVFSARFIWRK